MNFCTKFHSKPFVESKSLVTRGKVGGPPNTVQFAIIKPSVYVQNIVPVHPVDPEMFKYKLRFVDGTRLDEKSQSQ